MVCTSIAEEPLQQDFRLKHGMELSEAGHSPCGKLGTTGWHLFGLKEIAFRFQNIVAFQELVLLMPDQRIFHEKQKSWSPSFEIWYQIYLYNTSPAKETCLCVNSSGHQFTVSGHLDKVRTPYWHSREFPQIDQQAGTSQPAVGIQPFPLKKRIFPLAFSHPCSLLDSSLPSSPPTTDLFIFKSFFLGGTFGIIPMFNQLFFLRAPMKTTGHTAH